MSYTKTNWNNNTAPYIDDTNLNHIEQGIFNNDSAITALNTRIDNLSTGMPVGSGCDYFGTTLPSEDFMWADGSAISRTTYADLFAIIGTTYGIGDGSTTFNLPDKRERVSVMYKSDSTKGTTGATFNTMGAKGGEDKHQLTSNQLPKLSGSVKLGDRIVVLEANQNCLLESTSGILGRTKSTTNQFTQNTGAASHDHYNTITINFGNNEAHNILQPYLVCNYIIKVK